MKIVIFILAICMMAGCGNRDEKDRIVLNKFAEVIDVKGTQILISYTNRTDDEKVEWIRIGSDRAWTSAEEFEGLKDCKVGDRVFISGGKASRISKASN